MRNDERRPGLPYMNKVAQMAVVCLDVALTRSEMLALEPEETPVEYDLTLLAQCVWRSRVICYEDTDNANPTGELHRSHEVVQRHIGVFVALRVVRLVAHALAALIGTLAIGLCQHLVNR